MNKIYIFLIIILQTGISTLGFSQKQQDNINSYPEDNTSLIQITAKEIEISTYPNPASKSLTFSIKGVDLSSVEIEIFELTGQPVMIVHPDNMQYTIDVTSFMEGMYFYKFVSSGKVLKSEKFIVLKK